MESTETPMCALFLSILSLTTVLYVNLDTSLGTSARYSQVEIFVKASLIAMRPWMCHLMPINLTVFLSRKDVHSLTWQIFLRNKIGPRPCGSRDKSRFHVKRRGMVGYEITLMLTRAVARIYRVKGTESGL